MFFIIHNSDGDTRVEPVTEQELLERLNSEWYGTAPKFMSEVPTQNTDTNYWGENAYLIIKGEVITPKPVTTVTQYMV